MRIEGGALRGRPIVAPHGQNTRPTDGRTREMLFNSLGEFIIGARVLDLYAGTGAVGMEALSRGAKFCVFIESEFSAVKALKSNLKTFGLGEKSQVWAANARSSVQKLEENGEKFDFIFADPPFTLREEAAEIAKRLDSHPQLLNNLLVENSDGEDLEDAFGPSLIVIQHSFRHALPELPHLRIWKQKKAGESLLSFLRPHNSPAAGPETISNPQREG